MITIETLAPEPAEALCRQISADLPDYFGLPNWNEYYAKSVYSRISFAASVDGNRVGLLVLEQPYPSNLNVYWLGVYRAHHRKGIGRLLMDRATQYAKDQGAKTMTVKTLSPLEEDAGYLKTYQFYRSCGFEPLFGEQHSEEPDQGDRMVYLLKQLEI